MRRLFTTGEALARGLTMSELKWGTRNGRWRRVRRNVYAKGPEDPTNLDRALAKVIVTGQVASGHLAAKLYDLDTVELDDRPVRRRILPPERIVEVHGFRCTDGLQTLVDLAATLDDLVWEHALESALRKGLLSIADLEAWLPRLGRSRVPGTARIRRVLALRAPGAPPTDSLLETLMIQLARDVPGLAAPVRQFRICNECGEVLAKADLAWPEIGLFIELDGEQHKGQPHYDARRETAIVAATGWLCGRFTWREVVCLPVTTRRRLAALVEQARRRPLTPGFVHP